MRIHRLVVSPWQANCYFLQPFDDAPDVVIVDPGLQGADSIDSQLDQLGLHPVALLGTHGHIDHVGDAHLLAERHELSLYLTEADQPLLTKPGLALSPDAAKHLWQKLGGTDELPAVRDVVTLQAEQEIGGMKIRMLPAPGHTKGSAILDVVVADQRFLLTGDVVFAGSIGRTDFPGGSMTEMRDSLRRILTAFDHELSLLPGHGDATTLATEAATNPYLQDDFLKVD